MSYLRNNKVLLAIIATLLVVNIGLLYYSFWRDEHRHDRTMEMKGKREDRGRSSIRLEKEVGFSAGQLEAFEKIRKENRERLKPLFDELKIAKDSFYGLLMKPAAPDSLINRYATAVSEKQEAIDRTMLQHFVQLKSLATAEQQPKMDSFIASIVRRMAGHRGPEKPKEKK